MSSDELSPATVASRIITEDGEEAILTVADLRYLARCCRALKRRYEAEQALVPLSSSVPSDPARPDDCAHGH